MGREWIYLDELKIPRRCPYCGGKRFIVEGARKVYFEAIYKVSNGRVETEDDMNVDVEWEVAYGVTCAECESDLSEQAGF